MRAGIAILLAAALLPGCVGGSRNHVLLAEARYPVSMSGVLLDPDGIPVEGGNLEVLGPFRADQRGWSIGWTTIALDTVDFSEEVNRQVEAAGGEGLVRYRVTAEIPVVPDAVPGMVLLHWLPIWPGSVIVRASGDIVRRRSP